VGLVAAWQLQSTSFLMPELEFWCSPEDFGGDTGNGSSAWVSPGGDPCNMYDVDYTEVTRPDLLPLQPENTTCTRWEYSTASTPESVASQFNLICGRDYLKSLSKSVYMAGKMAGAIVSGVLSDRFGRARMLFLASLLVLVSGIAISFSPDIITFSVLRCIMAASTTALFTSGFVYCLELVGGTYSTLVSFLLEYSWAVGILTIPLYALVFPRWNHLQLSITLPTLLFVILLLIPKVVPESPRWLLAVGRKDEAEEILGAAEKENGRATNHEKVPKETAEESKEKDAKPEAKPANLFDLFRTPHLRKCTLIMYYLWFTNNLVYYGLTFNLGKLIPGDLHVNLLISGALEILAYSVAIVAFLKLGRRMSVSSFMGVGGVALLLTTTTDNPTAKAVLAQLGKFAITASFAMVYQYAAEIYPTQVRNVGVGSSSFASRLGSISAPFVGRELGAVSPVAPVLIFGLTSLLASALSLLLPETKGRTLPDTIEEGEKFCSSAPLQCLGREPKSSTE